MSVWLTIEILKGEYIYIFIYIYVRKYTKTRNSAVYLKFSSKIQLKKGKKHPLGVLTTKSR